MNPAISRRDFMGSALGAAATPKGPNDSLVIGAIGVGNQGAGRLREFMSQPDVRIGAICDVDRSHLDRAIGIVEKEKGYKPEGHGDFRRLLGRNDIDAVVIVTPDHWHSIPTVAAFEAGKDVFVEKPLSYSVAEGRAMADATLRYRRVSQMGNHIHNDLPNYRRVAEIVKAGKLGKITLVHAWKTGGPRTLRGNKPPTLPEGFDYDFWLGPAPKRPYEPLRSHGSFRHFWDYSGGSFIDFWCHITDAAYWAMDWKAPTAVSASGGRFFVNDGTETPDTLLAVLEFPGVLYQFSFRPAPLPGFEHMGHIGCLFEGTEASLVTNYETHEIWVKGKKVDGFPKPEPSIPDSPGHIREFLDAVKSRNLETTCNLRYGHRLSKAGLLANIAYRLGRKIQWDDENERIQGDDAANRFLTREFRKPWKLPRVRREKG